jgi:hypothetical protein
MQMPSQYFDTANQEKFQCDFAFKADQVSMLLSRLYFDTANQILRANPKKD